MPNAIYVSKTLLGSLKQYIYQIPNITQTITQEQVFTLDKPYGTLEGMKLAVFSAGNSVTISSHIYEKSGVSTPTVYTIYERPTDPTGVFQATGLSRAFINNDVPQANQIYGTFRNAANSPTYTITVAFLIKD